MADLTRMTNRQLAELEYIVSSEAAKAALVENFVGWPY
jgi:hypothetical protein